MQASSADAWAKHEKEVMSKCAAAAHLSNVKAVGSIVTYDDKAGMDALLMQGNYPQAHMKNQPSRVLCLFDRHKRAAYIAEADNLIKTKR
ncbi:hypothetical protein ELY11_07350 [Legionella septentrionalis]|uniref:Uncharacterized protein n=2 Tax=Legionellaceae TaxID=444 RepID=A0A3S0XFQ8_9GAMM|nr:hypothetical protein EKM59_08415 [Legionella septentrionalis]RUQ96773.1 hypothetical protein ELY11_07350 [Legionella septentrionalis]RUR10157.1 hypothetical protein ELY14_06285 [Legionella septentrionalis]RUR15511.1 hypothetical protein ELY10_05725 [Legionella septentrionalis]